jgi:imidazolonepropionase-like amidohydrolase
LNFMIRNLMSSLRDFVVRVCVFSTRISSLRDCSKLLFKKHILIAAFIFPCSFVNAQSKITAIKAGKLIDVVSGTVLTNQIILIDSNKIINVGPGIPIPKNAKVIDLSNSTVLPGLMDCHTHLTHQAGDNYYEEIFRTTPINDAISSYMYAKKTLDAGFTMVRDVGSWGLIDISLRNAINEGVVEGPRMLVSAFPIGSTGGHVDLTGFNPDIDWKGNKDFTGVADGVDQIRKRVRNNIKWGADWIKFMASGGVLSEEETPGLPQYSFEEMKALVDEAHMWGKKVCAHAHGTEAIKLAVKAGVTSIEHGSLLDDEGIQLMKEHGTYLVSDIYNDDYILAEYTKKGYPEKIMNKERMIGRLQRENFEKAAKAGVKIAYGTDAGVYPHGWNGKQFYHMVKYGLTPMQAIQSATINAADLLDWKDKTGSITKGKLADIIAVDKNPVDDITVLEHVKFVMKDGVVYKNEIAAPPVAEANKSVKVIKAGKLIDVETGEVRTNQTILIEDGIIKSIGARIGYPDTAEVIDLSNATILPGLMDCHTHISGEPSNDYYADLFRMSSIDYAVRTPIYAKRTLEAGFTTCRDLGAPDLIDISLRDAINKGEVEGPRMYDATFALGATGGHSDLNGFNPNMSWKTNPDFTGVADGVDEIRKRVRNNIKFGADVIKVCATAGVLSEEESVGAPQYSLEEMKALVDEAHMWGRKVAAHAHGTEGIKRAVEAGVNSVEHCSILDDETINMMKQRGTYMVPTMYALDYIIDTYSSKGFPPKIINKAKSIGELKKQSFAKAVKAGVKIAYGTDAYVIPHGWNAKDFPYLIKAGMTPLQAIQCATINSADLLSIKDKTGSLTSGKWADIIAVEGNPLEDITQLEHVKFVMKEGVVYKNDFKK